MSVFITGDIHGHIDIEKLSSKKWKEQKNLTKNDYLIIAGDFGLIFDNPSSDTEKYWLDWLDNKNFTTLFIDGNHENFDLLGKLEETQMFGGPVGKVRESIYHLKRGFVYVIDGKKIFTFGGAQSIDKAHRLPYISWWPEEVPNFSEQKRGLLELRKANNKVDYIITHEGPESIRNLLITSHNEDYDLPKYIDEVISNVEFKHHFFGHHHIDKTIGKHSCLIERIVELK